MKKGFASPISEEHARGQVTALLKGTFHRERPADAELVQYLSAEIAGSIWCQFGIGAFQWEAKHLRWFLRDGTAELSLEDRHTYYLTVERVSQALGKWERWEDGLASGPWAVPPAALVQPAKAQPAA
ncbi:hypothetical protein FHW79_005430 [Azospirillum sp. OGB3]|uniref:hypothetical protein n=1 Tax=Azospirillum sp. OGB3 TaxID=2587012 RepID=UPI001605E78E|nr:hypothetical protein [Azospirillum sp. OGB3]MBB3267765.1 hypothetical protein [Azospirillum sp. OGB3]